MSEALATDDMDHQPPSKKIRLSIDADIINESVPSSSNTPGPLTETSNSHDYSQAVVADESEDTFDPVQEILEAGKKCQEEEERRLNAIAEPSSPTGSTNKNPKQGDPDDGDVLSVSESGDETDSEEDDTKPKKTEEKSQTQSGKKKVKRKTKKSSNMRRNIKDILTHDQLDDLTVAARKEEEERRHRMNLKLQQQQQQLRLLQQQQYQLLQESLGHTPIHGGYSPNPTFPVRYSEQLLLQRLMRRKIRTVSLDKNGVPVQKNQDSNVDCIQLSSDEEATEPVHHQVPSRSTESRPQPQPELNSNSTFTSQSGINDIRLQLENKRNEVCNEVIAISSGEDDNTDSPNYSLHSLLERNSRQYGSPCNSIATERKDKTVTDSDDDCVILSPEPDDEEVDDDKDECSQDLLNVPDHLGRVLINVGHPEEEDDVFLPSQIAKIVKPHQIGGIRFLYDNVVESKDR